MEQSNDEWYERMTAKIEAANDLEEMRLQAIKEDNDKRLSQLSTKYQIDNDI